MFQGTGALAFDAAFYLQQNPDVSQAIQNGTFQGSALDHFVQFGQFEGRDPNQFFDTEFYLAQNPDVLGAIGDPSNASVTSAFQHFVMFGFAEGIVRAPSAEFAFFNPQTYLEANPDLQAAFGDLTGEALNDRLFQHFVEFGVNENRPGSGVVVETIELTTGIDAIVGTASNDTFTAILTNTATVGDDVAGGSTIQTGDQINGGAGVDTLRVTAVETNEAAPAPRLVNVERVEVTTTDADVTATLDLQNALGVQSLSLVNSAGDAVFTNATAPVSLTVSNSSGDAVLVYGAGVAAAAGGQNVILGNVDGSNVAVSGATTFNVDASGENTLSSLNGFKASDQSSILTTVNIAGAGTLAITEALASTVTTVNAAANTGGVDLDLSATGNVTVTGGAGDDRFVFGAGLTVEDTVNGGAGFDTVVVSNGGSLELPAAAAAFNALKSIERVEFSGDGVTLQGSTFTNAGITNLLFNTAGTDTVLNAGSARTYEFGTENTGGATFELKSAATTLNIDLLGDGEGSADVGNISVLYATGTAATAVTTLNLTSLGDASDVNTVGDISIRAGSTIVIEGDTNLLVGDFTLAAGGTEGAGVTIDASGFTGNLEIGGSVAGDIFIFADASSVVLTVNAGESGQVEGPAGGTQNIVDFDVVTGFTAGAEGDVLSFGGIGEVSFATVDADLSTVAVNLLDAANFAIAGGTVAGETVAGGGVGWTAFEFGGQTYAVYNADSDDTVFSEGTDVIVQLNGVALDALTEDNFGAVTGPL